MPACAYDNPKVMISVRGFGFKRFIFWSSRSEAMEKARKEAQADAWAQLRDKANPPTACPSETDGTSPCKPYCDISNISERFDFDWEVVPLPWPINYYYVKCTDFLLADVQTGCR